MISFCESGHPVFRGASAAERGDLKSKGKRKVVFFISMAATKLSKWFSAQSYP